jgi:epoxyqueuosine reductase QueG
MNMGDENMGNNLNYFIENELQNIVLNSKDSSIYRRPLVGFTRADNPLFHKLKEVVVSDHLLPRDLLKNANSVISFFIPFTKELIIENKNHHFVSREWAVAYVETNKLIHTAIEDMGKKLGMLGIESSGNPAKMIGYDHGKLMSKWSQRHVAYICGLGTFGVNNMLITNEGCGGRYGSFVIDKELEYTPLIQEEYCLWKKNKSCGVCFKACPVNALTEDRFDRYKCYDRCSEVDRFYSDIDESDACGKCLTGPCAIRKP